MPGGRPHKTYDPANRTAVARKRYLENCEARRAASSKREDVTVGATERKRKRKSNLFEPYRFQTQLNTTAVTKTETASQQYFKQLNSPSPQQCSTPKGSIQVDISTPITADTDRSNIQPLTTSDFIPKGRGIFSFNSVIDGVTKSVEHSKLCDKANTISVDPATSMFVSAKVTLSFKCTCGWYVSMGSDSPMEMFPINESVALASAAVPLGFQDFCSLFTILETQPPTYGTFRASKPKIENYINSSVEKCLAEAGEEEKRLAVEANDFVLYKGEKVPFVKVVCDGSWAKRSYGHSYTSNYGTAAIIGVRTKKVLFSGVRSKLCSGCKHTTPETQVNHLRSRNWTGPSTAMEADIIHEGFSKSLEMHGLVYFDFVADGDSSTYSRIKDVYEGITVPKIECINHVIRNMNSKLRNIAGNTVKRRYISKEERSLPRMEHKFRRIGLAVQSSCRYYKALGDSETNWILLREDIKNIPYHVFSRHVNCKPYFQCSMVGKEPDLVDQLENKAIFLELVDVMDKVAGLSKSIIKRQNSNIVECFFNVVAKYLEGKRKNLGGGSLYSQRIAAAVLSFNKSKFWVADSFKMMHHKSPSLSWKREQQRVTKLRARHCVKKKPRVLTFPFLKSGKGDGHYGSAPDRPDMVEEMLLLEKNSIREKMCVTKVQLENLEIQTLGQSDSDVWFRERRLRITASNAKMICGLQDCTDNHSTLRKLLCPSKLSTAPILYGRMLEEDAICAYVEHTGLKGILKRGKDNASKDRSSDYVYNCGLFVSSENGCLAASPDGLIGAKGLLEVKCPTTLQNKTIRDWITEKNICPLEIKNDEVSMKTEHAHYYQAVMQVFVTGAEWCDYFIWSPSGQNYLQRISNTPETALFWEKMKMKLIHFWEQDILPEMADSKLDRKQKPRVPEYRQQAMTDKQSQRAQKLSKKQAPT